MGSYKSITLDGATISHGNSKLCDVPNISLLPIVSCPKGIPCAKDCYDCKASRIYPSVREARKRNWQSCQKSRDSYFAGIRAYLARYSPRFFRWHVGGDIPDADYLREMRAIAREFPRVRFLAFTKAHDLNFRRLPDNLKIVFSMWPGWGNVSKRMPRAWMRDQNDIDPRIPSDAIECPGGCDHCGMCWSLGKLGRDVVFDKH